MPTSDTADTIQHMTQRDPKERLRRRAKFNVIEVFNGA
jgi:hypothetical protein